MAVAVACMVVIALPSLGRAAVISELFLADDAADGTDNGMPNAIELTGLDALSATTVDLIVIDAGPRHYGEVQRVISLPATSKALMISEQAWPSVLWGSADYLGDSRTTLADLKEGESLAFDGARTVLLYDRVTKVSETDGVSLFSDVQQAALDGASRLDQLTFVLGDAAVSDRAMSPVLKLAAGNAAARRLVDDVFGAMVGGAVTEAGTLVGSDPEIELTPGLMNIGVEGTSTPEPATAPLLLLGLALTGLLGRSTHRWRHVKGRCAG